MLSNEKSNYAKAIKEKDEMIESLSICEVCLDRKRDCVLSCGHLFCSSCISGLLEKVCPTCRVEIKSVHKVFL